MNRTLQEGPQQTASFLWLDGWGAAGSWGVAGLSAEEPQGLTPQLLLRGEGIMGARPEGWGGGPAGSGRVLLQPGGLQDLGQRWLALPAGDRAMSGDPPTLCPEGLPVRWEGREDGPRL